MRKVLIFTLGLAAALAVAQESKGPGASGQGSAL